MNEPTRTAAETIASLQGLMECAAAKGLPVTASVLADAIAHLEALSDNMHMTDSDYVRAWK